MAKPFPLVPPIPATPIGEDHFWREWFHRIQLLAPVISMPTGTIIDFAGTSAPTGYLPCDGTAYDRTTYAALFAVIGTTWGAGNGSTTFNVPNIIADYATVQAASNVGTSTHGAVIAHTHTYNGVSGITLVPSGSIGVPLALQQNTGSTGGTDNLAAGVRVMKLIKS